MRFQVAVSMALIGLLGCQADKEKKIVLETQKQKVSYSIGLDIGRNLKQGEIDIDVEALGRGIKDAVSDSTPLLTEAQIQETMQKFQQEMIDKQSQSANLAGEKNTQEGETFLAENAKKEGVITLPSGLQYKVIKAGTGKKPKRTDKVTAHYRGTLIDGTEFASSYKLSEPASFSVDDMITGLTEGLQLMPVGSKWQLFIPPNLAYGPRGAGNAIGPNAALIFDIELLAIK